MYAALYLCTYHVLTNQEYESERIYNSKSLVPPYFSTYHVRCTVQQLVESENTVGSVFCFCRLFG